MPGLCLTSSLNQSSQENSRLQFYWGILISIEDTNIWLMLINVY